MARQCTIEGLLNFCRLEFEACLNLCMHSKFHCVASTNCIEYSNRLSDRIDIKKSVSKLIHISFIHTICLFAKILDLVSEYQQYQDATIDDDEYFEGDEVEQEEA